jgi:hypothetical protein
MSDFSLFSILQNTSNTYKELVKMCTYQKLVSFEAFLEAIPQQPAAALEKSWCTLSLSLKFTEQERPLPPKFGQTQQHTPENYSTLVQDYTSPMGQGRPASPKRNLWILIFQLKPDRIVQEEVRDAAPPPPYPLAFKRRC